MKKLEIETQKALEFILKENVLRSLDVSDEFYAVMVEEFLKIHGEESLQALAGFKVWVENESEDSRLKNKKDQERAIISTFAHDLGGRHDKFMLPRSDKYGEFWVKYFETYADSI